MIENIVNIVFVLHCRDKDIPEQVGKHIIQFSLQVDQTEVLFSNQVG